MGGRHSKRSVDISGGSKEGDEAQPLDGKLEKLEEPKMAVNGASHSEHKASEQLEEQVSNGDPVSLPEAVVEEAGTSSPSDEVQVESPASETIQPPKKKEKVKKKWSLRSLSFSKKDKLKPGKDELAKEETEGVPEVTEEKAEEGGASFMSSVSEAISSATEAVGDSVVAAEHKIEEGLTTTQDQVEKISAKVAEKAEALVSKMEAMTVQAVDAAQEMIGMGHPHGTTAGDKLPAGEEGTATTLPESPKVDSVLSDAAKVSKEMLDTAQSKLAETPVTNVTVPEPALLTSGISEAASVVATDSAASGNLLAETIKTEVTKIVAESDIPVVTEIEVTAQEVIVSRFEEMPPPLPASPPPTSVIGDVVTEVVDSAVNLGETKKSIDCEASIAKFLSPTAAQAVTTISEVVPAEVISGSGDEPQEACEPRIPVSMPVVEPSVNPVVGEIVTEVVTQVVAEVIETSELFVASTDPSNQANENAENEENVDDDDKPTSPEILKKASETSATTKDQTDPPPEKSAEE